MVYFITLVDPSYMCYMGKHKEENEELIRWGWPEDVWFHVDKLSSAHVYLRLKKGQTTPEDIPREVLDDCVQLVKQNSIEGCKKPAVDVVYTMWSNLRKTGDMQAGQVGFESEKDVIKVKAVKRDREAILRLKKNVREEWPTPDLQAMRLERDAKVAAMQKKLAARKRKEEAEAAARAAQEAEERSYDRLFVEGELVSNKDQVIDEDDFMM